jgi:hypothetical protein
MATPRSCDRAILALFPTLKCANTTWERALVPFGFRTFEFVLTKREALGLDQTSSSGAGQKRSAHMVPRGTKRLRPAVAEGALKLNVDHRCWYSIRTEFLMPEIAQLGICWLRTRRARYARNRFGMTQELEGERLRVW